MTSTDRERFARRFASLLVAVAANLAFVCGLLELTRPHASDPREARGADPADVLQVRLIAEQDAATPRGPAPADEPGDLPAGITPGATPLVSLPAAMRRTPRPVPRIDVEPAPALDAPATVASAASTSPPPLNARLQLYNADGSVRLAEDAASPHASASAFRAPSASAMRNPFVHRNPLPYTPTIFADAWAAPEGEMLGGELLRHATLRKTYRTPGAGVVTCVWIIILGGCGWGGPPYEPVEDMQRERVVSPPLDKRDDPAPGPSP